MANLTNERTATDKLDVDSVLPQLLQPLIADGVMIFAGALVTSDANGEARPGGVGAALGRAIQTIDNRVPPSSGPRLTILVEPGCFSWNTVSGVDAVTLTTVKRGDTVFIYDDHTVVRTDGGGTRSPAGYFVDVDPLTGLIWVQTGLDAIAAGAPESESDAATTIACAAWFIDPANLTGLASNSNAGSSADAPLLDEGELTRRRRAAALESDYGGAFPVTQNTVVTYMSAPPDALTHPIMLDVVVLGSSTLSYVFAPTIAKSSTIATIPTTRGGSHWWSATSTAGFVAGDVGKLAYNTTKGACAFIAGVTSGTADFTEWLTTQSAPAATLASAGPPLIAPAVSDAYSVMTLARIKVVTLRVRRAPAPGGAFGHWPVAFFGFQFAADATSGIAYPDAMVISGENSTFGITLCGVAFTQCAFEGMVQHVQSSDLYVNCYAPIQGGVIGGRFSVVGGLITAIIANASVVVLDGYVMLAGGSGVVDQQCPSKSLIIAGSVTLYNVHDTFIIEQGSEIRIQAGFYSAGSERFAGSGNAGSVLFDVNNGSCVRKITTQTWTTVFGGIVVTDFATLDGHHSRRIALSFDLTTLTFGTVPITVTAAALDDPALLNGNAVQPGTGASLRNT